MGAGVCVILSTLCWAIIKGPDSRFGFVGLGLELECVRVSMCVCLLLRGAVRCGQCGTVARKLRRRGPALRFFACSLPIESGEDTGRTAGDGGRAHARPRRVAACRVRLAVSTFAIGKHRCACVTRASRWGAAAAATAASAPCLGGGAHRMGLSALRVRHSRVTALLWYGAGRYGYDRVWYARARGYILHRRAVC